MRSRDGWLGVMMALIAGYVDAIGFTRLFDVFPANQSGNAVLLGVAIGDPSWNQGWRPGLSMVMFVVGVGLGFAIGGHLGASRRTPTLLAVEAVLLVVFAAVAGNVEGDVAVIGGYIVGSAIGAAVVSGWGDALWIPALVCAALVVVTALRPPRPAGPAAPAAPAA